MNSPAADGGVSKALNNARESCIYLNQQHPECSLQ
jgi:hypothetical protein